MDHAFLVGRYSISVLNILVVLSVVTLYYLIRSRIDGQHGLVHTFTTSKSQYSHNSYFIVL